MCANSGAANVNESRNSLMTPQPPSPMLIFEALQAHQQTSALRAGIDLKLFTAIAGGARTPEALAPLCGASVKGLRVLCDFLTIMGFLTKDEAGYGLTTDSRIFLVQGSRPTWVAWRRSFYPFIERGMTHVIEAVRKGGTVPPDEGSVSYDNPVWVDFARGMGPLTRPSAEATAQLVAGTGPVEVLHIAAGHGMYGITIAQQNPAAEICALDWKDVLAVAHENAVKLGVAERWRAIEGSAFTADYGTDYDVVPVTNFIHHFDTPTNTGLFEKVQPALKRGGKMAVREMAVNEDRITPPMAGQFAMTMLTTTAKGDAYSRNEIESMCRSAGFGEVAHHTVPGTLQTVDGGGKLSLATASRSASACPRSVTCQARSREAARHGPAPEGANPSNLICIMVEEEQDALEPIDTSRDRNSRAGVSRCESGRGLAVRCVRIQRASAHRQPSRAVECGRRSGDREGNAPERGRRGAGHGTLGHDSCRGRRRPLQPGQDSRGADHTRAGDSPVRRAAIQRG